MAVATLAPMMRCMLLLLALAPAWVLAQASAPYGYADEERDWGVVAGSSLRRPPYSAPTPREIPGAVALRTADLRAMLAGPQPPLVIDVISSGDHASLPGALWIAGAGHGSSFFDPLQVVLAEELARLTRGDKAKPLVFLCVNAQCWLSYNAALRAVALGYARVYWYRGGIAAWRAAGLPTEPLRAGR